jgi:hypothetical protein
MRPTARILATTVASRVAAGASRNATDPAVVTSPAMSNRSLTDIGMPANRDGAAPCRRRVSM